MAKATKATNAVAFARPRGISSLVSLLVVAFAALLAGAAPAAPYGLIGSFTARPGQGAALAGVLLEGSAGMPGCLSYVVAIDAANADTLWVTEVWTDKAHHDASLALPQVRAAIARGRPMIAGMGKDGAETRVIGGTGLAPSP